MTRLRPHFVLAACATLMLMGEPAAAQQQTKPNILLIVSDDTGYGDLGPYGGGAGRGMPTPSIDRLANEGGSRSDWERAEAKGAAEIEADAAGDAAEAGMVIDWAGARLDLPEPKAVLHMRIDRDLLEFFKRDGRGYQTRINAVLRAYKDAHGGK